MNNHQIEVFIGILLEADHDRDFMRIQRKRLRDEMNPFDIPNYHFIQMFRLNKESARNLIDCLTPHIPNGNRNSISIVKKEGTQNCQIIDSIKEFLQNFRKINTYNFTDILRITQNRPINLYNILTATISLQW